MIHLDQMIWLDRNRFSKKFFDINPKFIRCLFFMDFKRCREKGKLNLEILKPSVFLNQCSRVCSKNVMFLTALEFDTFKDSLNKFTISKFTNSVLPIGSIRFNLRTLDYQFHQKDRMSPKQLNSFDTLGSEQLVHVIFRLLRIQKGSHELHSNN